MTMTPSKPTLLPLTVTEIAAMIRERFRATGCLSAWDMTASDAKFVATYDGAAASIRAAYALAESRMGEVVRAAQREAAREAWDAVYEGLLSYYWPHDTSVGDKGSEEAFARARQSANADVDALIAAVRAEERARCASAIRYRMNMLANALPYDAGAVNVALSDMLEALTGGPHE